MNNLRELCLIRFQTNSILVLKERQLKNVHFENYQNWVAENYPGWTVDWFKLAKLI